MSLRSSEFAAFHNFERCPGPGKQWSRDYPIDVPVPALPESNLKEFATKKLRISTGANGQKEDAASPFVQGWPSRAERRVAARLGLGDSAKMSKSAAPAAARLGDSATRRLGPHPGREPPAGAYAGGSAVG